MIDSGTVLWGQAIIYTLYAFAVLIVMGVFAYKITRRGMNRVATWFFLGWAGLAWDGVGWAIMVYVNIRDIGERP